ncbi:hypothetical protein [Vibrio anguillarum]|uniref:hypothetical protein n=1 Tax=Vibrio anguillarum TaxID=55601 RepID=UPI0018FEC0B4|nr:hypothetical protein [Vibrio anguillarum]
MNASELTLLEHHHQLVNAIATSKHLSRRVRTLLVGIATFFNLNDQKAVPNRKQISERTGYCPNHITALVSEATKLGFIKSTPQYYQVDGESAPRQISNKYEFVLEKFGLYYSKAKLLLNRNLRKKKKEQAKQESLSESRIDHVNKIINEYILEHVEPHLESTYWDELPPPNQ